MTLTLSCVIAWTIGIALGSTLINHLIVFALFKINKAGTTIQDLVKYYDDEYPYPLMIVPVFSTIIAIALIFNVITAPLQIGIKKWYEKNKYKKI